MKYLNLLQWTRRMRNLGRCLVPCLLASACLLLLLFQAVSPAHADDPTFDAHRTFGSGIDSTPSVAVGDLNADGVLDLVVGNTGSFSGGTEVDRQNVVSLNDGTGHFPLDSLRSFGQAEDTFDVAVGDMNGDGALDIVVGNGFIDTVDWPAGQQNVVYLNDGAGNFYTGTIDCDDPPDNARCFGLDPDITFSVAVGDMDGDGDLDIIASNVVISLSGASSQNQIYLNDGTGHFDSGRTFDSASGSFTLSMAVGDVDGDGDLDIIAGNAHLNVSDMTVGGEENKIYLNDGNGHFGSARTFGSPLNISRSVAVGDLDGDGDLDLVAGNGFVISETDVLEQPNAFYLNDGFGNFDWLGATHPLGPNPDATLSVAVGDVNGDGILDLVVGNALQQNVVYLNDGAGHFDWPSAAHPFGSGSDATLSVTIGDVNDDGALDLIVGSVGQNVVYLNDGAGNFPLGQDFGPSADRTRGVTMGDMDGDGALDLIVGNGNQQNVVYLNDGAGQFYAGQVDCDHPRVRCFGPAYNTHGVAVGDVDGDGGLDIVVGNWRQENVIYLNDGAGNFYTGTVDCGNPPDNARCFGPESTWSVALGDLDGDGALDIVVGNSRDSNVVYLNDGAGNFDRPGAIRPFGSPSDVTLSVAVGDLDSDGDLDIVVGNMPQQNVVYLNDGAGNFDRPGAARPFGSPSGVTSSVSLGDLDGDGALDIVIGNIGQPNVVYLNDGAGDFAPHPFGLGSDITQSVAVGDVNGDGDLDLFVGNGMDFPHDEQNVVYLNDGSGNFFSMSARMPGPVLDSTTDVAMGDVNGDGTLDLVVGNCGNLGQQNRVYLNRSRQSARLANNAPCVTVTRPITTANANFYSSPVILDRPTIPVTYTLFDPDGDRVGRMAASYSLDGGGHWLPAVAASVTDAINLGTGQFVRAARTYSPTQSIPDGPDGVISATLPVSGTGIIADLDVSLSISHTRDSDLQAALVSPVGDHVTLFSGVGGDGQGFLGTVLDDQAATPIIDGTAPFSGIYRPQGRLALLNGQALSGTWRLVVTDTVAEESGSLVAWGLRIATPPAIHVYTWDTFASHVFGQSDNAVLRLEAYPQPVHTGITGIYRYTDTVPGPYHWPYAAATTFPFRLRGTQVRVYSETVASDNEAAGAIVYRLKEGQSRAELMGGAQEPFRTDINGYLQGRGQLAMGDRLVALLPVSSTVAYTIYHTSAAPTETGLDMFTVSQPGVQVLTVTAKHPLVLFDLNVSLEWDARKDEPFMEQLAFDLQRTSEFLYDWTNGQAALGQVTVYHDRGNWNDAHVRVYVSNRLRPNADQGGVVLDVLTETPPLSDTKVITYAPGQVRMAATWNRFGDPGGGELGEDWPRTLAHELGHYLFYLDDNYLGFDADGMLIPVDTCPGAMSDPYSDDDASDYDEFHPDANWLPRCENTLSEVETGRSDWATIEAFYHWLDGTASNPGPSSLPLAVTQVTFVEPTTSATSLDVPIFYLLRAEGGRYQPSNRARAFLFQDDRLIDLGRPVRDQVNARGARPGERLCVFDLAYGRLGCVTIVPPGEHLILDYLPAWQPEVVVTPVTSRTVQITVTTSGEPITGNLHARLHPVSDPAPPAITLNLVTTGLYAGTFDDLTEPAFNAYVHVWVDEEHQRREIVTDYAIGGNPTGQRGRRTGQRGRRTGQRGRRAPVMSGDGQAILFGQDLEFQEGQFYALQSAASIPAPPAWATVVGQAYRLTASPEAPDFGGTSLSVSYQGDEVPPGEEDWLKVYFYHGSTWQLLTTTLNTYFNYASAPTQYEGLYVLMSSFEIPLYQAGWNLFSYPVPVTRPVAEALLSIDDYYSTVYGYEATDATDPWKVYGKVDGRFDGDPAPEWVNDLEVLEFGRGYWINVSEAITLYLKGGSAPEVTAEGSFPFPPATYYGAVLAGDGFTPTADPHWLTAWVGDSLCGQALTQVKELDGKTQVVYVIDVLAEDWGEAAGCGAPGRVITFELGKKVVATEEWDNDHVHRLDLFSVPLPVIYLPFITK